MYVAMNKLSPAETVRRYPLLGRAVERCSVWITPQVAAGLLFAAQDVLHNGRLLRLLLKCGWPGEDWEAARLIAATYGPPRIPEDLGLLYECRVLTGGSVPWEPGLFAEVLDLFKVEYRKGVRI